MVHGQGKMAQRSGVPQLLFLVAAALLSPAVGEMRVRGMNPSVKVRYHPGRDFTCLDGSDTISFSMVNDDYCDCADGSDEPGTAACPLGRFYCINRDHQPETVPSSRVNDGICDCCDGSDEWSGEVSCRNTCQELGRRRQEEMLRQRELEAQGYQKKVQYEQQGIRTREDKIERMEQLKVEQQKLEEEVEGLKTEKEAMEEPERIAKEAHEKKWEEEKAAKKEEEKREEARAAFDQLDTDSNGIVSVVEIQARSELDDDGDGEVSPNEALAYLDNEAELKFEAFLDRAWSFVSDKCTFEAPSKPEEEISAPPPTELPTKEEDRKEGVEEVGEEEEEGTEEEGEREEEDYDYEYDEERDAPTNKSTTDMPPYPEDIQVLITAADKAREVLKEAEGRKRDVDREVGDLNKYIGTEMGEAMEFSQLYGNCYEFTDREYTYKMCAFEKVTQQPKDGGRETLLGTWGSWNGPRNSHYSRMLFNDGEGCWNGPKRSTNVGVSCGLEEKLIAASEPNRCEYAMEFETPAACHSPTTQAPPTPHGHQEL